MEIPLGPVNTGSTHKAMGTPSRHFVTWQLMEVPQCFFFFVFKCWFFSLLFTKQVFFPINRRLDDDVERYFGKLSIFTVDRLALCYIACNSQPACQSLNFRLSDRTCQFNKKLRFLAQPVWSRMQDLFTLITQIEVKQIKTNFLSLVGRHNFKGLPYIMSPLSYKASRNAESLRHFVKEH